MKRKTFINRNATVLKQTNTTTNNIYVLRLNYFLALDNIVSIILRLKIQLDFFHHHHYLIRDSCQELPYPRKNCILFGEKNRERKPKKKIKILFVLKTVEIRYKKNTWRKSAKDLSFKYKTRIS